MKKIYIAALAVFATAAMSSCVQEKSFNEVKVGENGIVFSLQGSATTRATEVAAVQKGARFELDVNEEGEKLYLEETIEDLNYASAATRGTPAYTENVGKLYKDLGVVIHKSDETNVAVGNFWAMDDGMVNGGWRYQGEFAGWPDENPLDFYLWMPVSDNGVTSPIYKRNEGKQTISFRYTSPATAEAQKDLIFAARPISKSQAKTYRDNGVPVLFNHALTGVKFAIANYDEAKNITIKSITFEGLVNSGSCVVTPASENNYRDNKTNYSSAAEGVVVWTLDSTTGTFTSGDFGAPVDFKKKSDGGGSFGDKGDYPDSFAAAGNQQNLNKSDASQTFWFIPQAMTSKVKLSIVYTFGKKADGSDNEMTGVLEFGSALNGVTWEAGQLRTYTIRVDEVNVKIEDTVAPTKEENKQLTDLDGNIIYKEIKDPDTGEVIERVPYTYTYYGGTKSGVTITNTGNTDAFIRAALIGQWLDEEGDPVFGFTDYTAEEVVLVDSWYQDQFVTKARKHGSFTGLVGYNDDYSGDWVLCEDGYYYYTKIVREGATVPTTDPLFVSYTVDKNPAVAVAGKVHDVYFRMEIATQAVTGKKIDGTDNEWDEAWKNALGEKPVVAE